MKGKIHYSKYGRVQVVGENSRVYSTGLVVSECSFAHQEEVEFDILDDKLSKAGNFRSIKVQAACA
jgi:hypothetical protein